MIYFSGFFKLNSDWKYSIGLWLISRMFGNGSFAALESSRYEMEEGRFASSVGAEDGWGVHAIEVRMRGGRGRDGK